jgi:hypothetical protein
MTAPADAIDRLLAATPYPPATAEVAALLAAADQVSTARARVLAAVQPSIADAHKLAELEQRQQAWQAALTAARQQLARQQVGVRGLRAYASRVR